MKWSEVEIGSLCRVARGGSPRPINQFMTEDDDGVNWIKISDATASGKVIRSTKERIKPEGLAKSRAVFAGDFLLSNSMSFGRPYLLEIDGAIHDGWLVLQDMSPRLDKAYLYEALQAPSVQSQFQKRASGTTVKNLNAEIVRTVKIPLPPLEEQKRIAGILDEADRVLKKTQALIDKYDELAQSLFLDMFGDPATNSKGWEVRNFSEFISFDTRMTNDFVKYGHLLHLGIGNIERDTGRIFGCRSAIDEGVTSGKYLFDQRHVIYSKIRPELNKVAVPDFKGLCSADAYPLLPIPGVATRHFVAFLLKSDFFLNFIKQHSTRTNMPKANKKQLALFSAFCPPFQLQQHFDDMLERVAENRKQAEQQIIETDKLMNSLLQKAFKGELI